MSTLPWSWLAVLSLAAACDSPAAVAPTSGRTGGGEPVRITGEGFTEHGPPIVYFGPRAAKAVVVESDRLITVIAPEADGPGVVDVSVRYPDGVVDERAGAFTYEDRGLVLRAGER